MYNMAELTKMVSCCDIGAVGSLEVKETAP